MEAEKIDKRVRETSLRKFITISGQLFVIILSLCTDTGSACYESYLTFPEVCRYKNFTPKIPYFTPSHHEFIAKIRYNKRMDMYIQKSAKGRRSL